jgi:hypothetical protein
MGSLRATECLKIASTTHRKWKMPFAFEYQSLDAMRSAAA